ncbi:DUF1292 domain-containing protein [Lachnospiraceae bacterium ZAX-1]
MSKKEDTNPKNSVTNDEEDILVTLTLDDDTTLECSILTIFDVDDEEYIALLPLDENGTEAETDGEMEILFYRYGEDADGNPDLKNIEDDEEYELVADRFDELLDEAEFDEED